MTIERNIDEWLFACKTYLDSKSFGLSLICGDDDSDMLGYFADGYSPEQAADELLSYATE